MPAKPTAKITLDPNDPFDKLLIPMVETNRKKRADYANDNNIYANFDYTEAATMGMVSARDYCDIMVAMKTGRIMNLRGKDPKNESIIDTYLDRAVYSILAYGLLLREQED
jgi:hypothetical protein